MEQVRLIQNKIDSLVNDMGKATFLKLLHFIVEVMEDGHEIKVLMVRRFLDIFLEFEEIIRYLYDGTVEKKGKIVTNVSIALLKGELQDKTILVVDDIRLHGRALEAVGAFLVKECNCKEENIAFKVFADNQDAFKVESRFGRNIEVVENVDENRWKKISSSIINSLYISGQPYVSHLPYYKMQAGTAEANAIEAFIQNEGVEEITTEVQKYYGVQVYLYFMDYGPGQELNTEMPFAEQSMVRIYIYNKLGKIIIVPYAFLKPFSLEGIVECYKVLCGLDLIQGIELPKPVVDAASIREDAYIMKYLYSMEVYVLSLMLGSKFLANRKLSGVCHNKAIEEYNFGFHFDISNVDLDLISVKLTGAVKGQYADNSNANLQLSVEPEVEELVANVNIGEGDADRFLESYIKLSGRRDEELARQNMGRMRGIEYLRLHRRFLKKDRELWKTVIRIVDSGKGTLAVSKNYIDQKPFMDSLLFAGEQNFTCNESDLIYLIYPLLEYECLCKNRAGTECIRESDMVKEKSSLIDYVFNYFPELRTGIDDREINDLREKSLLSSGLDYYMGRYSVYEGNNKLREVLKHTRQYAKGIGSQGLL